MQTILVTVDGSTVTPRAVTIATDLAAALGARIVAVSVLDGGEAQADAVRWAQRRVETSGRQLGIEVSVSTVHAEASDVGAHYVRIVADLQPDLVVMPVADPTGELGRAVETVLVSGRAPVLVVPPEH